MLPNQLGAAITFPKNTYFNVVRSFKHTMSLNKICRTFTKALYTIMMRIEGVTVKIAPLLWLTSPPSTTSVLAKKYEALDKKE